jgi:hypothetical protein
LSTTLNTVPRTIGAAVEISPMRAAATGDLPEAPAIGGVTVGVIAEVVADAPPVIASGETLPELGAGTAAAASPQSAGRVQIRDQWCVNAPASPPIDIPINGAPTHPIAASGSLRSPVYEAEATMSASAVIPPMSAHRPKFEPRTSTRSTDGQGMNG